MNVQVLTNTPADAIATAPMPVSKLIKLNWLHSEVSRPDSRLKMLKNQIKTL